MPRKVDRLPTAQWLVFLVVLHGVLIWDTARQGKLKLLLAFAVTGWIVAFLAGARVERYRSKLASIEKEET